MGRLVAASFLLRLGSFALPLLSIIHIVLEKNNQVIYKTHNFLETSGTITVTPIKHRVKVLILVKSRDREGPCWKQICGLLHCINTVVYIEWLGYLLVGHQLP